MTGADDRTGGSVGRRRSAGAQAPRRRQEDLAATTRALHAAPGPDVAFERALAKAHKRGRARVAELLAGKDMLTAQAFAVLLGTTRATVHRRRREGLILGLGDGRRGWRFPVWQLAADGRPHLELPELLARLGHPWMVYRFLLQPHGSLDGLTGLEALEHGKATAVLAAVDGILRGDFT